MSEHRVPTNDNPIEGVSGFRALVTARIRPPASVHYVGDGSGIGDVVYTFTPDLTVQQAALFAALLSVARGAAVISLAGRDAIEGDLGTLRTYVGIANPTAAQTAAATKALIRALRVLLRD